MPEAIKGTSKQTRVSRKPRPELAAVPTVDLLEQVASEAMHLRAENKRLSIELSVSRKRIASLEKRTVQARRSAAVSKTKPVDGIATVTEPKEKKATKIRQALGIGLARFLGNPRRSGAPNPE